MDKDLLLDDLSTKSKNFSQIVNSNIEEKSLSAISKYNIFVQCYNTPCNRVDEKTLIFVPESKVFNSFYSILINKKFLVLLLLALLIPLLNLFPFIYMIVVLKKYFKALKIYRKNQRRVNNPFANMKYDPQKCFQLKKNFHFMKIQFKSLRPQFNFKENTSLTQSQGKQGNKSQWMIYNSLFESYYTELPRCKRKIVILMITGIIEVFASIAILFLPLE